MIAGSIFNGQAAELSKVSRDYVGMFLDSQEQRPSELAQLTEQDSEREPE